MSCHGFGGNAEIPDRSLGTLTLSYTGEQLEDISAVNLERMSYLDSPAPSLTTCGDFVTSTPSTVTKRSFFGKSQPQTTSRPGPDPEAFDRLSLLDEGQAFDAIESVDWLSKPPKQVAEDFNENDRSFLDTNLLYSRFNLLNFVTHAINEEVVAETRKQAPPSRSSNLNQENVGSGATFKVNRPSRRTGASSSGLSLLRPVSDGVAEEDNVGDTDTSYLSSANQTYTTKPSAIDVQTFEGTIPPPPSVAAQNSTAAERRQKYLTYRRGPTRQQDGENGLVAGENYQKQEGGLVVRNFEESHNERENGIQENYPQPVYTNGMNYPGYDKDRYRTISKPAFSSSRLVRDSDGSIDDSTFGSDGPIDTRTYTRPKKTRMPIGAPNRSSLNSTLSLSPISPIGNGNHHAATPCQNKLNTTIDLSPVESRPLSVMNRTIDTSPNRDHGNDCKRNLLNTTMDLTTSVNASGSAVAPSPHNLNETFLADNSPERSRRVTRNVSYVIQREDEPQTQSTNNNKSPQGLSKGTNKPELNNTFCYEPDGDVGSPVAKGSQNTSMEDLNSRVASQIKSLGCSTFSKGRLPEGIGRIVSNLDDTRTIGRTSSTDTYSVAQSSESPTSSGLSSPMEAQSYDDIQSESVRRSMPNLAGIRGSVVASRSGLPYSQAGSGQLRKNHYISDSKLSRLGSSERPRLSLHPSSSNTAMQSVASRGLRNSENMRTRGVNAVDRNTSTPAALNRVGSGLPSGAPRVYSAQALGTATVSRATISNRQPTSSSMGNVRSTGIGVPPPRFVGSATSGLRPPRAMGGGSSHSSSESIRNSTTATAPGGGIPVPTGRVQSRIPGPGQLRFSRLPTSRLPSRGGATSVASNKTSYQRGKADDWRDGCY